MRSSISPLCDIGSGVPQGSGLGPLLFLFYINNLPNVSQMFSPILFAGDTTLSTRSLHYNSLIALINRELLGISGWMETTKLSLNVGKTIMMLMSNRQHGAHFDDGGVLLN